MITIVHVVLILIPLPARHFPGKDFNEVLLMCRRELLDSIAPAEKPLTKVSGLGL